MKLSGSPKYCDSLLKFAHVGINSDSSRSIINHDDSIDDILDANPELKGRENGKHIIVFHGFISDSFSWTDFGKVKHD